MVPPSGDSGCSVTLRAACSVGVVGIGCSVCATIGLSVPCSVGGDGFCCYGALLIIKISANCSTSVVALGPYSKKGDTEPVLQIIVMISRILSVALSCDDMADNATFLGNNWMVSEILSPPVDVM